MKRRKFIGIWQCATISDFNSVDCLELIDILIFWIFGDAVLVKLGAVEKSISAFEPLKNNKNKSYSIISYMDEGHNVKQKNMNEHFMTVYLRRMIIMDLSSKNISSCSSQNNEE